MEDVTDYVQEREGRRAAVEQGQAWQRRVESAEADLYARARELAEEVAAKDLLAHRLAALADVALELAAAETIDDLERIVVARGLSVLGAAGGGIVSPEEGGWRVTASSLGSHVEVPYGHLPYDSPLARVEVARTGQRILLSTRASGLAFHPPMAQIYADTGRDGWAFLPLTVRGECLGSLAVAWTEEHEASVDELNLLDGFAAQRAQALDRIRATDAQEQAMRSVQRMSETLQRSMLVHPSLPAVLDVAVRYQPASREAQVGGDWYDAFTTATGATTLVIGDVHGHDQDAAAAMGQIRNLLRGMTYHSHHTPAELLTGLDSGLDGLDGLEVNTLATAVICRIHHDTGQSPEHVCMRWSNAGHLPPLLREPDGTVHILDTAPDLLLGFDAHTPAANAKSSCAPAAPCCSTPTGWSNDATPLSMPASQTWPPPSPAKAQRNRTRSARDYWTPSTPPATKTTSPSSSSAYANPEWPGRVHETRGLPHLYASTAALTAQMKKALMSVAVGTDDGDLGDRCSG